MLFYLGYGGKERDVTESPMGRPTVDSEGYIFMILRMKGHDSVGFSDTVLSSVELRFEGYPLFFCAFKDYRN